MQSMETAQVFAPKYRTSDLHHLRQVVKIAASGAGREGGGGGGATLFFRQLWLRVALVYQSGCTESRQWQQGERCRPKAPPLLLHNSDILTPSTERLSRDGLGESTSDSQSPSMRGGAGGRARNKRTVHIQKCFRHTQKKEQKTCTSYTGT